MKKAMWIAVAGVLIVGAFIGGTFLASRMPWSTSSASQGGFPGGPGFGGDRAGGMMTQLSDQERAQLQNMSDSERQAFFQKKFGAGAGGRAGGPGMRSDVVTGTVASASTEQFTVKTSDGGSRTVYLDADTLVGFASGTQRALSAGDEIVAVVSPEADNVLSASAIVVK